MKLTVRRSDEIQADLAEHAGKYNMLTGDRPCTGFTLAILWLCC